VVVSDNAPEFVQLKEWLSNLGTKLINTPPYNPSSNGQAERAVRTVKDALKCYCDRMGDKYIYLQKVLLNHRSCSGKISPAEQLLSYKPRTTVNSNFTPGQKMVFKNKILQKTDQVKYIVQAGNNTAWVNNDDKTWLASLAQLTPILDAIDDNMQTNKNWKSKRKRRPPIRYFSSKGE